MTDHTAAANIGETLRRRRIANPYLWIRDLARLAGLDVRDLADIEIGRRQPTRDEYNRIVRALNRYEGRAFTDRHDAMSEGVNTT